MTAYRVHLDVQTFHSAFVTIDADNVEHAAVTAKALYRQHPEKFTITGGEVESIDAVDIELDQMTTTTTGDEHHG
jgi:hypothetical protein